VGGDRINACLALAVQYQDRAITTIEGVGTPARLDRLQTALIEQDSPAVREPAHRSIERIMMHKRRQ